MCSYRSHVLSNGYFTKHRNEQDLRVLYDTIEDALRQRFYGDRETARKIRELEQEITAGRLNPYRAAAALMDGPRGEDAAGSAKPPH